MTRQQIITRAATHPAIVRAHMRYVGGQPVQPEASLLEALADGWIDTVIEEMLAHESVKRGASQQSYSLSTTSGTDTYTLPTNIGRVLDVTVGSDNTPLHNFVTISDYNRWRSEVNPEPTTTDDTVGYYFPSRDPTTQALKITFVHAAGTDTATVWFLAQSEPPYSLSIFPTHIHHVIMQGVLAKMSGDGAMEGMYRELMENAGRQLTPKVGGFSRARHDPKWRIRNWRRSNMPGGGASSWHYPPHRTN